MCSDSVSPPIAPATTARPCPMRLRSRRSAGARKIRLASALQSAHTRGVGLHRRPGKVERRERDVAGGPSGEHEEGGTGDADARDTSAGNRSPCEAVRRPSRTREVILRWMVPLSVLDLVPVRAGLSTARCDCAIRSSWRALCERLGYARYWLAEHHGMASIASSVAGDPDRARRLGDHAASASARAASCCRTTRRCASPRRSTRSRRSIRTASISASAARRAPIRPRRARCGRSTRRSFPSRCASCWRCRARTLPPEHPFATVRVVPADVRLPPIWVLASSGATAAFAGALGLGYGFARHFSPAPPGPAIRAYRAAFRPSAQFPAPARDPRRVGDLRADRRGSRLPGHVHRPGLGAAAPPRVRCRFRAPRRRSAYQFSPQDRVVVEMNRQRHFIGTPPKVASLIRQIVEATEADEIMVTTMIYGRAERLRSLRAARRRVGPGSIKLARLRLRPANMWGPP